MLKSKQKTEKHLFDLQYIQICIMIIVGIITIISTVVKPSLSLVIKVDKMQSTIDAMNSTVQVMQQDINSLYSMMNTKTAINGKKGD